MEEEDKVPITESKTPKKNKKLKLEERFNRHQLTNDIAKEKDFCTLGSLIREENAPLLKALDGQLDSTRHQQRQMRKVALSLERKRKIHASYVPDCPDKRSEILNMNNEKFGWSDVKQSGRYSRVNQDIKLPKLVLELKNKTLRKHLPNSPATRTQ